MKVAVAYIRGPRGIKGELAAQLYKENSKTLRRSLEVVLSKGNLEYKGAIEEIKELRGRLGLKISGIDTREDAISWSKADLLVEQEFLEPLDKDEFYIYELKGMAVYSGDKLIGQVEGVESEIANAILNIRDESGKIIMIPFVKAIIKKIDKKAGRILINYIEGLY